MLKLSTLSINTYATIKENKIKKVLEKLTLRS